jgi:hypothetical protein
LTSNFHREENIDTGLNQNKKLIEECNKLKEDNDYLVKKYKAYDKTIKEANRNNKRLLEEQFSRKQGLSQNAGAQRNNLLLDIHQKDKKLEHDIVMGGRGSNGDNGEQLPKIGTSNKSIAGPVADSRDFGGERAGFPTIGKGGEEMRESK